MNNSKCHEIINKLNSLKKHENKNVSILFTLHQFGKK